MQPNTKQLDEVEVPAMDLKAAFESTDLNRIGYNFDKAMDCPLIKRRLVRMALNKQQKKVTAVEVKSSKKVVIVTLPETEFWWQKYY
jgi:hypothetical protein